MSTSEDHIKHQSVRDSLALYYSQYLTIQSESGGILDLNECYVNHMIFDVTSQQQLDQEQDQKQYPFVRTTSFTWRSANESPKFKLENLFNKQTLQNGRDGIPKRILIQGQPGTGKTSLCKKLVKMFMNGQWNDLFDAVIWMPLRQLKAHNSRNLEDLIKERFFSHYSDQEKQQLSIMLLQKVQINKVLFILDGLDEISNDAQIDVTIDSFLTYLIQQENVVITSEPQGVDIAALPTLDLNLEVAGFDSDGIESYVNNVLSADEATCILDLIQKTPIIQKLFEIPGYLDSLCYSSKLQSDDSNPSTLTNLYRGMINIQWNKDAVKIIESITDATGPSETQDHQITQFIELGTVFLGYLAFQGIRKSQIEFDDKVLDEAVSKYDQMNARSQLPLDLPNKVKKTSFLRMVGSGSPPLNDSWQSWYFADLTIQEYFAATWLARQIDLQQSESLDQQSNNIGIAWDKIKTFIQESKYNPRFEILWWMLAGLLEGRSLELFYEIISDNPKDLIEARHANLARGLYNEASYKFESETCTKIESDIAQFDQTE